MKSVLGDGISQGKDEAIDLRNGSSTDGHARFAPHHKDGSSGASLGQSLSPQGPPFCHCHVDGCQRAVISEKKRAPPCKCEPDEIDPPSGYFWVATGFRGLARIKSEESVYLERVTYKCAALVTGFGGRFFRKICSQHQWQLHHVGGVGFCKKCAGEPKNTRRIITIDVALQDDDVGIYTYLTICQVETLLRTTTPELFALVDCGHDMDVLLRDGLLGLKANFGIEVDNSCGSLDYRVAYVEHLSAVPDLAAAHIAGPPISVQKDGRKRCRSV